MRDLQIILPREAGKGDRPAKRDGGRGAGSEVNLFAARPLHRPFGRSPSPAPFHFAGEEKQSRSRSASAPELRKPVARISEAQSGTASKLQSRPRVSLRSSGLLTSSRSRFRQIKEAERRQTCFLTSASCDAARIRKDALACRRSTAALTVGALARSAQLQARFPGTRRDVRPCTGAPTGRRRPRVLPRALSAPACPSPGKAPPGPVVVPANMMPEAARERIVSVRTRAPHSLRFREYPRPKASFTERDSQPDLYRKWGRKSTKKGRGFEPDFGGLPRQRRQSVQTETRRRCLSLKWPTMMTMKSTKVQMPRPPRVTIWRMPVPILPT